MLELSIKEEYSKNFDTGPEYNDYIEDERDCIRKFYLSILVLFIIFIAISEPSILFLGVKRKNDIDTFIITD